MEVVFENVVQSIKKFDELTSGIPNRHTTITINHDMLDEIKKIFPQFHFVTKNEINGIIDVEITDNT